MVLLFAFACGALAQQRGIVVEPLDDTQRSAGEVSADGSAGLFVGIGSFDRGSNLGALKYAPDDAIALAHLFVLELRLIPPARARVALGGTSRSGRAAEQLGALKAAGVQMIGSDKNSLITALRQIKAEASQPSGLIVVSVATHGFEDAGGQYLMPSNGLREEPATTGIPLNLVRQRLLEASARKRLLLLDACREAVEGGTRGSPVATAGLRESFEKAEGFAVLGSCSARQLSWEADDLQQGVFTHFFLEALRGGVTGDAGDGLIRLGDVAQWVASKTAGWVRANRNEAQEPWTEGEIARQIPLAVDGRVVRRLAAEQASADRAALEARERAATGEKRRKDALKLVRTVQADHEEVFAKTVLDDVESALGAGADGRSEDLVRRIERHFKKPSVESDDLVDFLNWWKSRPGPTSTSAFLDSLMIPTNRTAEPQEAEEQPPGSIYQRLQLAPSKDRPYENSLGMKFVPIPGSPAWFSIWETRVRDFQAYATANPGTDESWIDPKDNGVLITPQKTCPVVNVSWDDAVKFCSWLTESERKSGAIPASARYRLPTDAEWSLAVGLEGESGSTPMEKDGKITNVYPWGTQWPPTRGAGNYCDITAKPKLGDLGIIEGYDDGYAATSPAGRFTANRFGLYDMGGNVWEWCADHYDGNRGPRVLRGGALTTSVRSGMLSSGRNRGTADARSLGYGFRVVLEGVSR